MVETNRQYFGLNREEIWPVLVKPVKKLLTKFPCVASEREKSQGKGTDFVKNWCLPLIFAM
ncbi:hypothetical protein [Azospira inquinata]|uniref:Uncharacterized protein n=1 Tax=Azospira inquinata TaxID=2785627 RepID=A0A975XTV2_9RHOO|nr:hypothetical protein [Azospira inquinata]QWT46553.1 hypothetical protein J8L76_02260 [Azospira inquinata]QWT48122.1 hypothetical protein Azoinq_09605 [Azospira inquinata]